MTDPVSRIAGVSTASAARRVSRRRGAERRAGGGRRRGDRRQVRLPAVVEPPPSPAAALPARRPAAFAAQLLGQGGQKRGLRGGPETLDKARNAYLEAEWSGAGRPAACARARSPRRTSEDAAKRKRWRLTCLDHADEPSSRGAESMPVLSQPCRQDLRHPAGRADLHRPDLSSGVQSLRTSDLAPGGDDGDDEAGQHVQQHHQRRAGRRSRWRRPETAGTPPGRR